MPRDGLVLVDKPAGVTSHDVVNLARRAFGERRIGHAGTLDPFATGLLVLLLGRATRLLPYVSGDPKIYDATIRFGQETDTDDLHGAATRTAAPPALDAVHAALPQLTGAIDQLPPAYSAKRVNGRRAYTLARSGEEVTLAPARVRVDAWEVRAWHDATADVPVELDVRITCGPGTYIRALARDLGRAVGSAAHLAALRRTRSGAFDVADAVSLDALRERTPEPQPARDAVPEFASQALDATDLRRVFAGIAVDATASGERAALVDAHTGRLVAVAVRDGDRWQPRVVLHD
ncbi:tRNA pseudouridine synthase B [Gemmatimonadetes bacterium T265]|nr:tRNA pseudouridine synthase B [Gemmatimonadetes bacterium T265]